MIIRKLPHWVITNKQPGFYDTDSGSTIEQTALVYRKMQELIDNYNLFVDEVNKTIEDFINDTTTNYEEFKLGIEQKINDFTKLIELKIDSQDSVIAEAINYMKTNLPNTVHDLLLTMFETNELSINFEYDDTTESLNITGVVVKRGDE